MSEQSTLPEATPAPVPPSSGPVSSPPGAGPTAAEQRKEKIRLALIIGGGILILASLVTGVFLLVRAGPDTAGLVRDIFIIFMGLVSLLVMVALIILIIQLSILINLLQNEIKPILNTTTETVNNLRGTTVFISNNLVEPIIKLNESLAGLRRFFDIIRPGRS